MNQLFEVVESIQGATARFEILRYKPLSDPLPVSQQRNGQRVMQVRIVLNDGKAIIEAGALQFHKGNIEVETLSEDSNTMMKKLAHSVLTGESPVKPICSGTGEIYLEPGFHHYVIYKLHSDEVIVDKGIFYCCESTIKVNVMQKGFSVQTKLSGTGICVLKSPVPEDEILKLQLNNERLQVDGSVALLHSGNLSCTVERSVKSLISSLTSKEGYLQTFSGTGIVWLAPTRKFYKTK